MTLAGEAQLLRRDRSSSVNLLFAMLDWSSYRLAQLFRMPPFEKLG